MRNCLRLAVFAAALLGALAVSRGTARAAVGCTVSAGQTIAFGSYDVFAGAISTTATINGTCHKDNVGPLTINITLGNGNHLQGNGNRAMACTSGNCLTSYPNDLLQYQLYTDAAHSTPWIGSTSVSTACPNCGSSGQQVAFTPVNVYGSIPAATAGAINDVSVGGYSDTVVITLCF